MSMKHLYQPNWQFNIVYMKKFVLKYLKTNEEKIDAIKQSRLKGLGDSEIQKITIRNTVEAIDSMQLVANNIQSHYIFGNPLFLADNVFLQERGLSFLDQFIRTNNVRQLIDRFFLLNIELWKYGLFEGTFDFLRNCGSLRNGVDFFIDLGNFIDDKDDAIKILKQKRWKDRLDYLCLRYEDQHYFSDLANIFFTQHVLSSIWRKKL